MPKRKFVRGLVVGALLGFIGLVVFFVFSLGPIRPGTGSSFLPSEIVGKYTVVTHNFVLRNTRYYILTSDGASYEVTYPFYLALNTPLWKGKQR